MRRPMLSQSLAAESRASSTLCPNDHVRLLTELLRPAGAELARRWLAALLVVDEGEREAMVAAVEKRVVELYGIGRDYPGAGAGAGPSGDGPGASELVVVHPPRAGAGFVERVEVMYGVGTGGVGGAQGEVKARASTKAKPKRRKA